MELIPSIDLRHGRVVRLERGKRDRETVYFDDPLEVIARFRSFGVSWIHVVDLDAAFGEAPQTSALARIVSACRGEKIEQGGGLRSARAVAEALDSGVDRVVLGSLPLREPRLFAELADRFPGRIVPAWEVEGGELRVGGWERGAAASATDFSMRLREVAELVPAVLVTDISRDGMLSGANCGLAGSVAAATGIPAIVSGGVASLADVERARATPGIGGLIVGKAFYEGRFDLGEAMALVAGAPASREAPVPEVAR